METIMSDEPAKDPLAAQAAFDAVMEKRKNPPKKPRKSRAKKVTTAETDPPPVQADSKPVEKAAAPEVATLAPVSQPEIERAAIQAEPSAPHVAALNRRKARKPGDFAV